MGEETKQEQAREEEAEKPEAEATAAATAPAAAAEEEEEEKKEDPPQPPSPCVFYVDLHCVGCAKNIQKSILKIKGVEGVEFEMSRNEVTVKGVIEPQAICAKITKKTKRRALVLSPHSPPALGAAVNSQVTGLTTVELSVNLHCKACAEQLKTKILKMRGVRSATTELGSGKVTVTGTMDANELVDYVYRRTKKQAKIIPQPEPEAEEEKPAGEERKPEEKKEEQGGEKPPEELEGKKEGDQSNKNEGTGKEETKELEPKKEGKEEKIPVGDEQTAQRMMYYYQPLDVMERIPPAPQLFSDENPNACCIA